MNPDLTQLQAKVDRLEGALRFILSDRYVFSRLVQLQDGANFQFATGTGTKIGTNTDQKLSFFGVAPVVQPLAHTVSAATNVHSTSYFATSSYGNAEKNMLNYMYQALIGLGLIAEDNS